MTTSMKRMRSASAPQEVTRTLVAAWEQKRPALKALNDATLEQQRGYAIQAAKCIELCGSEEAFKKVAKYWKQTIMWLRGITIEYEHASKSYRFIEVDRHLSNRQQRVMVAMERKHREEAVRLGLIRDNDMADHQRRLRALFMNQHSDVAGKIESQREHARIARLQPETLPRIG